MDDFGCRIKQRIVPLSWKSDFCCTKLLFQKPKACSPQARWSSQHVSHTSTLNALEQRNSLNCPEMFSPEFFLLPDFPEIRLNLIFKISSASVLSPSSINSEQCNTYAAHITTTQWSPKHPWACLASVWDAENLNYNISFRLLIKFSSILWFLSGCYPLLHIYEVLLELTNYSCASYLDKPYWEVSRS